MIHFNEQLKQLYSQTIRKQYLENTLKELYVQQEELVPKVAELEAIKQDEQGDVERLEGGSLAAFFYGIIGKMDEVLDREKKEAYAARVKYDAAIRELEVTEYEIQRFEKELEQLAGCELEYEKLLREKEKRIRESSGPEAEEILRMEEKLSYIENQIKEIKEAIAAGQICQRTVKEVESSLNSADGWATYDMFGGGMISSMIKHERLDEAQSKVNLLQIQLRKFKTELADIKVSADIKVNFEGFTRFADFFFDNLFMDWEIKDQIDRSKQSVKLTAAQIEESLNKLEEMLQSQKNEKEWVEKQLQEKIVEA